MKNEIYSLDLYAQKLILILIRKVSLPWVGGSQVDTDDGTNVFILLLLVVGAHRRDQAQR